MTECKEKEILLQNLVLLSEQQRRRRTEPGVDAAVGTGFVYLNQHLGNLGKESKRQTNCQDTTMGCW